MNILVDDEIQFTKARRNMTIRHLTTSARLKRLKLSYCRSGGKS